MVLPVPPIHACNVDDKTLDKLEPIADRITREESSHPDRFIPIFEQAIYPRHDIRALRQLLTNDNMVQGEDEDAYEDAYRLKN